MNRTKLLHKILLGYFVILLVPLLAWLVLPASFRTNWKLPIAFAGAGVLATVLAVFWARSLDRRLHSLIESADRIAAGDLSTPVQSGSRSVWTDETDHLLDAIERTRENFTQTLRTVRATSLQTNSSSTSLTDLAKHINVSIAEISGFINEMTQGAELQAELMGKTAALIGEMARSIAHTSRSAEDAARSSAEASNVAQSGCQLAGKAVDKMRSVFEEVEKYARRVFELGERTKEIGNIVRVITEVAQQTHLLAINATIEAARAGEAGRGFAVVAEEIRQLADNTSRSAERISGIVEEITASSQETVQAVKTSTRQLSEGRDQLTSIGDTLRNIVTTVTNGSDRVQIISRLAREQIAGAEQTVKAFDNISEVARRNASSTDSVLVAAEAQSSSLLDVTQLAAQISALSGMLDAEVQRFKLLEGEGERTARR